MHFEVGRNILAALLPSAHWARALTILGDPRRDRFALATALRVASTGGASQRTVELLESVDAAAATDVVAWNASLAALGAAGRWQQALALFTEECSVDAQRGVDAVSYRAITQVVTESARALAGTAQ